MSKAPRKRQRRSVIDENQMGALTQTGEFELVRIVGKKRDHRNQAWYQVEWSGNYPYTWEPVQNLTNSAEAVAEFESILAPFGSQIVNMEATLRSELHSKHKASFDQDLPITIQYSLNEAMRLHEYNSLVKKHCSVVHLYTMYMKGYEMIAEPAGMEFRRGWRQGTIRIYVPQGEKLAEIANRPMPQLALPN